jgi:hypothetical protein
MADTHTEHPCIPVHIFYEGDVISGRVYFDAVLKSESIKGISVSVTVCVVHYKLRAFQQLVFMRALDHSRSDLGQPKGTAVLNKETDLWTPTVSLLDGSKVTKGTRGKYTWPFSLTLPTEVEVQAQKTKKSFLPPVF